ncbi:MAG: xanthine dehydrogenase family protein subunit M [Pseudomonadota bacterium]|nr:xanthine dehydrogenase family protein subunit M [Pseudomonadota bacterium]
MHHTTYVKAGSTDDAIARMADGGQLLAGGMTLIPTMKQRLASPEMVVDLAGCGLAGIEDKGDSIRIGAMTRHADVAGSELVQGAIPALAALAGGIGDRQVRNCGTIGGSVANNDPSACYPAAVLGLGGTVHTNRRDIAADDFFTGMFETALDEDEMITAISFPKTGKAAYVKFPNPASRYAMVGVFVASTGSGTRVAVTGAGSDGVFRHGEMESALDSGFSADSLDGIAVDADEMISDIHASGDYRAHLVREIAKRAVAAC